MSQTDLTFLHIMGLARDMSEAAAEYAANNDYGMERQLLNQKISTETALRTALSQITERRDALKLENRGLTRQKEKFFAEFEQLQKECDDANKIAAAAKTEIEWLVAEVSRIRHHRDQLIVRAADYLNASTDLENLAEYQRLMRLTEEGEITKEK